MRLRELVQGIWESPTATTWGAHLAAGLNLAILLPLALAMLSSEEAAAWLLFGTISIFVQSLGAGFAPTTVRLTAYAFTGAQTMEAAAPDAPRAEEVPNWRLLEDLYRTTGFFYLVIASIAALLLSAVGTLTVKGSIGQAGNGGDLWLAWWVLVAALCVAIYGRRYGAFLAGSGYLAAANRWQALFNGSAALVGATVLLAGGGVLGLILTRSAFMVAGTLRSKLLLNYVYDQRFREFRELGYEPKVAKEIWGPSWRSGIGVVSAQSVNQGGGIIYAQFAGSAEIGAYLLAQRLVTQVFVVAQAPFQAEIPAMARLRARGDVRELYDLSNQRTVIALWMFVTLVTVIGLAAPSILPWIGSETPFVATGVWALLSFAWFNDLHNFTRIQLQNTTNRIIFHFHHLLAGALFLAFLPGGLARLGVIAIPALHLISRLLVFHWRPTFEALRSVDRAKNDYFLRVAMPPAVFLLVGAVVLLLYRGL
jgi:O-antigen/teichoic acid export membrane protein